MSQKGVERILGRLLTDEAFGEMFFADHARAILSIGVELTRHETEALLRIPRAALHDFSARLDDRICKLHLSSNPQESAS